jgi:hypothetical protein
MVESRWVKSRYFLFFEDLDTPSVFHELMESNGTSNILPQVTPLGAQGNAYDTSDSVSIKATTTEDLPSLQKSKTDPAVLEEQPIPCELSTRPPPERTPDVDPPPAA